MSTAIETIEAADSPGVFPVLRALGLSRATFYRFSARRTMKASGASAAPSPASHTVQYGSAGTRRGVCSVPGRRLSEEERATVKQLLYGERFVDRTPTEVFASLLDEGVYHCSVRTMYRLLKAEGATTPRTRARSHAVYEKPELLATRPNQLWSWDITRLKGPRKWTYFCRVEWRRCRRHPL